MVHESSKQVYLDGGIYHNNPINVADRERKLIWPSIQDEQPDLVVSIGTLYCDKPKEKRTPSWPSYSSRGIIAHGKHLQRMAQDHIHSSLDSERTWETYLSIKAPSAENKRRYVRINPQISYDPPKLDAKQDMESLREKTRFLVGEDPQIKVLAHRLIAACFYFDAHSDVKEDFAHGTYEVAGKCHCGL
jgi:hypothetical protein